VVRRKHPSYGDLVIVVAVLVALWGATHPEDATILIRWTVGVVVGVAMVVILVFLFRHWRESQPLLDPQSTGQRSSRDPAPVPGPQQSEARPRDAAVRAAATPTRWSLQLLQEIEWKRFEELCSAYFEARGRVVVRPAPGADEGIDFYLYGQRGRSARPLVGVRCKAGSTSRVGVKAIRELLESMNHTGCPNGLFITSATYTPDAEQFAKGKPIELLDAQRMLTLIGSLPDATQAALLALATHGDYRTPSCPSCGTKLVERSAQHGNGFGSAIWACNNYPTCRYTVRVRA
jgi:restriction system protein